MLEEVDKFIDRNQLLRKGTTVVVGVSGGPDSMALLHYLFHKQDEWQIKIIAAHLDHMFRGEESEEDARFTVDYCREHRIQIEQEQKNLPLYIEETGESPQHAARYVRYRFFEEVMKKHQADYLALAHHGDDQVETMVMNLVRGTSTKGLSGIPSRRAFASGEIIRPFLTLTKEQILHYCKEEKIPYRIDPSNTELKYTRNRFRKSILPFFKEENPQVHERFQNISELLEEDERYLREQASDELDNVILKKCDNQLTLSVHRFLQVAIPLQRRMIHLILNYLYKTSQNRVLSTHIKNCLDLIGSSNPSGSLHLPDGLTVRRNYDECLFSFEQSKDNSPYTYTLRPGGHYELPVGNLGFMEEQGIKIGKRGKNYLVFDTSQVQLPLYVRTREAGDRIHPAGVKGSRKLKDVFIDAKLPRHLRDIWPIVVDSTGKIIWIPGIKHAELPAVSPNDGERLYLYFENITHEV
ncbi:tRNA lysidine(34) synthetase TilS [Pseudalkalibacillus sp. SCS-8]|uniref:tRNA lysidine(34) synthetase TilS n=1 Tax=Pseudalkalibacillus nanhaiensis TaxID=3115291 RepID=UPI0032DA933A